MDSVGIGCVSGLEWDDGILAVGCRVVDVWCLAEWIPTVCGGCRFEGDAVCNGFRAM